MYNALILKVQFLSTKLYKHKVSFILLNGSAIGTLLAKINTDDAL